MEIKEITVDTSSLAGDVSELQTALSAVEAQLKNMFDQVTELDAMWDGPANEEFNRQFANDYENSVNLCKTVQSIIDGMQYAREQYDICENEVNAIISAIAI